MGLINKSRRKNTEPEQKQDIPPPTAIQEVEAGVDAGTDIFEYRDKEKERVEEWWLQKGMEEEIEEVPEPEELYEEGERKKGGGTDEDELIYSLKEEEEEEDELSTVLRSMIEEMGDMTAEELLDTGRRVLREMGGDANEGKDYDEGEVEG